MRWWMFVLAMGCTPTESDLEAVCAAAADDEWPTGLTWIDDGPRFGLPFAVQQQATDRGLWVILSVDDGIPNPDGCGGVDNEGNPRPSCLSYNARTRTSPATEIAIGDRPPPGWARTQDTLPLSPDLVYVAELRVEWQRSEFSTLGCGVGFVRFTMDGPVDG